MIIDTHAHYDDSRFDEDRESLLQNLLCEGVSNVVNVTAEVKGFDSTLELIRRYDFMFGTTGVHPDEVGEMTGDTIERMIQMTSDPKIVAVGEIGLDYHHEDPDKELQKDWFIRQIGVARETGLPLIIHSRDAAKDTMDIMKQMHTEEIGGVIHCYSYHADMALEYVKMGFYIGVGGVVTYKNGVKLQEVVEKIPMERIVLETDSPYLTPVPFRGQRNNSANLRYVAAKIAEIKGISIYDVEDITYRNACALYPKMGAALTK